MSTLTKIVILALLASLGTGCAARASKVRVAQSKAIADVAENNINEDQKTDALRIATLQIAPVDETPREKRERLTEIRLLTEKIQKRNARELLAAEPPSRRKAIKAIEKEDRVDSNTVRQQRVAKQRSGLTCPYPDDFEKVWINPEVVMRPLGFVHARMNIRNSTSGSVSIKPTEGRLGQPVVRNLCAGGSLSLLERIGFSGNNTVAYVAEPETPTEGLQFSLSPRIQLYPCYGGGNCKEEFAEYWNITSTQRR